MNKALLEYRMAMCNVSKAKMCDLLGMSRSAFYRKCNGSSEFTQSEIGKIIDILSIDNPVDIFFNPKVS